MDQQQASNKFLKLAQHIFALSQRLAKTNKGWQVTISGKGDHITTSYQIHEGPIE